MRKTSRGPWTNAGIKAPDMCPGETPGHSLAHQGVWLRLQRAQGRDEPLCWAQSESLTLTYKQTRWALSELLSNHNTLGTHQIYSKATPGLHWACSPGRQSLWRRRGEQRGAGESGEPKARRESVKERVVSFCTVLFLQP